MLFSEHLRFIRFLVMAASLASVIPVSKLQAATIPFLDNGPSYKLILTPSNSSLETRINKYIEEFRDAATDQPSPTYKLAEREVHTIKKVLQSRGYYESSVSYTLAASNTNKANKPTSQNDITYSIDIGPRFTVNKIELNYPPTVSPPDKYLLKLQEGKALIAENVIETRNQLLLLAEDNYCFFQTELNYRVIISRPNKNARVIFTLQASPVVNFGNITYDGLTSLSAKYLDTQISLEKGGCFNQKKLDVAKLELLQTNLLTSVEVQVQQPVKLKDGDRRASQPLDIVFKVSERRHRTFKTGLGYSTDTKFGITLGWEHRNLLGSAQNLEFEVGVNDLSRYIHGEYTVPNFILEKQNLVLTTDIKNETSDAFESTKAESFATLSRKFNKKISATLGVAASQSRVIDNEGQDDFSLVSLPASITYDNRGDILNPTSGWTGTSAIRPFFDVSNTDSSFLQWTLATAGYLTAENSRFKPTLALRAATGALTAAALEDVPADQRFYAGGGGSVRGYAYQSVGEFDEGDPAGGKSYGEVSLELRAKVTGNWAMVLFTDGGYAYPQELPSFGNNFLWGAGVGVRYFTSFAPIRFDIAVPLDRRKDIDDSFQIYIGIGQAF